MGDGYVDVYGEWRNDIIRLSIYRPLWAVSMPDDANMVAYMDGPVVLAGICQEECALCLNGRRPEEILRPHNEFSCECRRGDYKTTGQAANIVFRPLHLVLDEAYQLYFPLM